MAMLCGNEQFNVFQQSEIFTEGTLVGRYNGLTVAFLSYYCQAIRR